jgi:hypothetical protein
MTLQSFLFGPVKVSDTQFSEENENGVQSVTLTPDTPLQTPCGKLNFPAGKPVFFSKVILHEGAIFPQSGGEIRPAD